MAETQISPMLAVGDGNAAIEFYLPRIDEAVAKDAASGPPDPLPRGHETLLVVEDSESLRDIVRELLTQQGYTVIAVTQGQEALTVLENEERSVDLVLTDGIMPKLGGGDLVARADTRVDVSR